MLKYDSLMFHSSSYEYFAYFSVFWEGSWNPLSNLHTWEEQFWINCNPKKLKARNRTNNNTSLKKKNKVSEDPTSNNLASKNHKVCPICWATCRKRSIRLLEENEASHILSCCCCCCCGYLRCCHYCVFWCWPLLSWIPTSPKLTPKNQHNTRSRSQCPGTQRLDLKCCTASSTIWVATQVASWLMTDATAESWRNSVRFTLQRICKLSISCRHPIPWRRMLKSEAWDTKIYWFKMPSPGSSLWTKAME